MRDRHRTEKLRRRIVGRVPAPREFLTESDMLIQTAALQNAGNTTRPKHNRPLAYAITAAITIPPLILAALYALSD